MSGRQIIRLPRSLKDNRGNKNFKRHRRGGMRGAGAADDDEEEIKRLRPRNAYEATALRIDKLFKKNAAEESDQPSQQVSSEQDQVKIKTLDEPIDLKTLAGQNRYYSSSNQNKKYEISLDGAIAAAQNGDYLLYENLKRKEAGMLRRKEYEEQQTVIQTEHRQKMEEIREREEKKREKKRAKRLKEKERKRMAGKGTESHVSAGSDVSSDSEGESVAEQSNSISEISTKITSAQVSPKVYVPMHVVMSNPVADVLGQPNPVPASSAPVKPKKVTNLRIIEDADF